MLTNLSLNWKAFWILTLLNCKKVLSFKFNFVTQVIGMMVNNVLFFGVWYLLLIRFGNINGYNLADFVLINGIVALFYGVYYFLFGGLNQLDYFINADNFLDLQLFPVSPLTVILTKFGSISNIGDIIFGIIFGIIFLIIYSFLVPANWLLIILALIIIITGFFGVSLIVNSLLFYFPRLRSISHLISELYIGASLYPSVNLSGGIKLAFQLLLVFPIVFDPISVIRGNKDIPTLIPSILIVIIANIVGLQLWKHGIRRVESGSVGGIME